MLPMQMDAVAPRDMTPRAKPMEWLGSAVLLTSLGMVTLGWCCFLALALWKAAFWVFDLAA